MTVSAAIVGGMAYVVMSITFLASAWSLLVKEDLVDLSNHHWRSYLWEGPFIKSGLMRCSCRRLGGGITMLTPSLTT